MNNTRTHAFITRTHAFIAVDPLPSGEILRAAFIGKICLKVWRHFAPCLACAE